MPTVVNDLVERYRALFRSKPVEMVVEIADGPNLQADRAVLSMVLGNLLRNALSFTSQGQVKVRVEHNSVEVRDTGTGFDEVDMAALFHPYVRGADSEGAGLGLSLVQRLCERHGWQVSLANLPEGGTVARLVFAPAADQAVRD